MYDSRDGGYTDIELYHNGKLLFLIEAKVGWILPSELQLKKYQQRFDRLKSNPKVAVISHCDESFGSKQLGADCTYLSWNAVYEIASDCYRSIKSTTEKFYLKEFKKYLGNLISMDREQSNWVYCVSLSREKVHGADANFIDIVYKYQKYFYPYNRSGWPKEPPNYIAFRYDGCLKSIHKVESFELNENLNQSMPKVIKAKDPDVHFFLHLGPPIQPSREVRNGNIWPNGRLWCMIDTLLTCDTIEEARNQSYKRIQKIDDART